MATLGLTGSILIRLRVCRLFTGLLPTAPIRNEKCIIYLKRVGDCLHCFGGDCSWGEKDELGCVSAPRGNPTSKRRTGLVFGSRDNFLRGSELCRLGIYRLHTALRTLELIFHSSLLTQLVSLDSAQTSRPFQETL